MAGTIQLYRRKVGQFLPQPLCHALNARGDGSAWIGDVAEDRCDQCLIGPVLLGEFSEGLAGDPACSDIVGCVKRGAWNGIIHCEQGNARHFQLASSLALPTAFSASPPLS